MIDIIMCKDGIMDDGGIVINSAVRRFMRHKTDEDMRILDRIFRNYMPYINDKTLCVAIRDLQPGSLDDYATLWGEEHEDFRDPLSKRGHKALTDLTYYMMTVYLLRANEEKHFRLDEPAMSANQILYVGQSLDCIKSYNHREQGLFENHVEFMDWAIETLKSGHSDIDFHKVKGDSKIPVPKEAVPDFQRLTVLAAGYAVNRQTYVPDSVCQFILDNFEIFSTRLLKEIWEIVKDDHYNSCWAKIKIWKD